MKNTLGSCCSGTSSKPRIVGLILAGGRATRMNNVDKGLQMLNQKPMVQHVIERLSNQVDELWICANRNIEQYRQFGLPVFSDQPEYAGQGPLAGVASFIPHVPKDTSHIQIVPCDTPFIPYNLTHRLSSKLIEVNTWFAHTQGVYPCTQDLNFYANALVSREGLDLAKQCLAQGNFSLKNWLFQMGAYAQIGFQAEHFLNINTPMQLKLASTQ